MALPSYDRFTWQREQVEEALAGSDKIVLNVGCNEDPAGLKDLDQARVINCDIEETDSAMDRPNRVDLLFDAAQERWPFEDGEACMVVLGDICEHLQPDDLASVLAEARRVADVLAITVPEDPRVDVLAQVAPDSNPYIYHQTIVTEQYLREALETAGWKIDYLLPVDYGFVSRGHFVRATS